jgi:predicted amidophosphoribosyltransferase
MMTLFTLERSDMSYDEDDTEELGVCMECGKDLRPGEEDVCDACTESQGVITMPDLGGES